MDIQEFKGKTQPRAKRSKLRPFHNDIVDLRENGYSFSQIAEYLANQGLAISVVRISVYFKNQFKVSPPEVNETPTVKELSDYPAHDPRMITQILGSPVDLDDLAKYAPKRIKP